MNLVNIARCTETGWTYNFAALANGIDHNLGEWPTMANPIAICTLPELGTAYLDAMFRRTLYILQMFGTATDML